MRPRTERCTSRITNPDLHGETYMTFNHRLIRRAIIIICAALFLACLTIGIELRIAAAKDRTATESESASRTYKWNVSERELPLLGLAQDRLKPGFDQILTYPAEQFDFPIFKSLTFDEQQGKYLLPAISKSTRNLAFIELAKSETANIYVSPDGVQLVDRDSLKIIKTADGTTYLFVRYPDDEFRCATIKQSTGVVLNLLYAANGLTLHGVIDSSGRSLTFNYGKDGIRSLTQTWMANSEGFTRTWAVGDDEVIDPSSRFAHALTLRAAKFVPTNAVVNEYTAEMAASDKLLAQIFGGPNAVAGANGFEPAGLAAMYPIYRGDIVGDDGKVRRGHLSYAMHLYGSPDGRGDSPLYVPAGFTSHSGEPSPTDAAVTFYYPRLGNLTDVTLAVFHIADFKIVSEGDRVRIGNIGGPGGSSPLYRHSHIEFYRGNVSLPAEAVRAALRINPTSVFAK